MWIAKQSWERYSRNFLLPLPWSEIRIPLLLALQPYIISSLSLSCYLTQTWREVVDPCLSQWHLCKSECNRLTVNSEIWTQLSNSTFCVISITLSAPSKHIYLNKMREKLICNLNFLKANDIRLTHRNLIRCQILPMLKKDPNI